MLAEDSKAHATATSHSFGFGKNIVQTVTLKRQPQGFAACAFLQQLQKHVQRFRSKINADSNPDDIYLSQQRQTDKLSPWHEVQIIAHTQRVQWRKRKLRKELDRLEDELESLRHGKLTSKKTRSCPQLFGLAGVAGICGTATTLSLGAAAVSCSACAVSTALTGVLAATFILTAGAAFVKGVNDATTQSLSEGKPTAGFPLPALISTREKVIGLPLSKRLR